MNIIKKHRKAISLMAVFAFSLVMQLVIFPLHATNGGQTLPPPGSVKKPAILTVKTDPGIIGTPPSGTYLYYEKKTVNYSYQIPAGYKDLVVKLDGQVVAASGAIIMNANHTLTASATKIIRKLTVTINVFGDKSWISASPPAGTYYYDQGTIVPLEYKPLVPPPTIVIMYIKIDGIQVWASRAPYKGSVVMNMDHTVEVVAQ